MLRAVQSSLVISTLVFYTSQQIGTTYSEFNSAQDDYIDIQACEIFPQTIEQLLTNLNADLQQASLYKNNLLGMTVTDITYDLATFDSVYKKPSATDAVYLKPIRASSAQQIETATTATYSHDAHHSTVTTATYDDAYDDISQLIAELSAQLSNLRLLSGAVQEAWDGLSSELAAGSASVEQLLHLLQSSYSNCVEIKQTSLLSTLGHRANENPFMSASMQQPIREIILYLRKVYEAGLELDQLTAIDSNQIEQPIQFKTSATVGEPVSPELGAYIRSLQESISVQITGITSILSTLNIRGE